MRLIDPLVSGMSGAGNGYAEIYERGTSTRATWYTDFEGQTANSSGANITLDSYGAAVVYVNETVDVIVKSSAGALVREFTWGEAASGVEVISSSFTGVNYISGATGVGQPVSLNEVLDRWFTSAGTTNWNVLAGGTVRTLQSLATILGEIFVVTDPQFGAVGDGTTDDLAAINACITACAAAGGGIVFFPAGTYKVSAAVQLLPEVDLVGEGPGTTLIELDHATADTIDVGLNTEGQLIYGLGIHQRQNNTGQTLDISSAGRVYVVNCWLGHSSFTLGEVVNVDTGTAATFRDCVLRVKTGSTARFFTATSAGSGLRLINVTCAVPATYTPATGAIRAIVLEMAGGGFDCTAHTTGNFSCVYVDSTDRVWVHDAWITANAGAATVTGIQVNSLAGALKLTESDNLFECDFPYAMPASIETGASGAVVHLGTRRGRVNYVAPSGGSVGSGALDSETTVVGITNATAFSVTPPLLPAGAIWTLIMNNTSGGVSGSITAGGSEFLAPAAFTGGFTIANGKSRTYHFRSAYTSTNTTTRWVMLGPNAADIP